MQKPDNLRHAAYLIAIDALDLDPGDCFAAGLKLDEDCALGECWCARKLTEWTQALMEADK